MVGVIKMNDATFEAELQEVFLNEAQEMLEDTETAFMRIEANPDDGATIDRIFRNVHTIKGSAHVAGFAALGNFAHTFETLLGLLREKKLKATSDIVDVLLAGNDCLRTFVSELRKDSKAVVDCEDVSQRIRSATPGDGVVAQIAKGNTAEATVPVTFSQPTKTEKTREQVAPMALEATEKRTFLICDDEPAILELLSDILVRNGYGVLAADNAHKALDLLRQNNVDAIMTDLKMPEMNGIEFVSAVRAFNRFVPIVFVSGHSSREHFKQFLDLGVDSFVEKPFNEADLLGVARRVVREKILRDAVLSLSKLSFRAYVSIQKIRALSSATVSPQERKREEDHLDTCMNDIRKATAALLDSERTLKQ